MIENSAMVCPCINIYPLFTALLEHNLFFKQTNWLTGRCVYTSSFISVGCKSSIFYSQNYVHGKETAARIIS